MSLGGEAALGSSRATIRAFARRNILRAKFNLLAHNQELARERRPFPKGKEDDLFCNLVASKKKLEVESVGVLN